MSFKIKWKTVAATFIGSIPLLCGLMFCGIVIQELNQRVEANERMPHRTISYEFLYNGQLEALKASTDLWNDKLGWRYFRLVKSGGDIKAVTTGDPRVFDNNLKIGVYMGTKEAGILFVLPGIPDGAVLRTLLCHELGHALDIEYRNGKLDPDPHTDNELSLMNPMIDEKIRPTPNPEDVRRAKKNIGATE